MSDHDGVEQVITMAWRAHVREDALLDWLRQKSTPSLER
jgi:hypothetical protein